MNFITVLIALINSLAGSRGDAIGSLVTQITGTITTGMVDAQAAEAVALPWITWLNGIVDANRDPTPAEESAARAFAAAVHANNQALGTGGTAAPLPTPPVA